MSEISKLNQNLIIKKIDKETLNLQITNNEMLMSVVGQFDQNLKELSKLTNTNIFFRGNSITCKGSKENIDIFRKAVEFLINKYFLTKIIEKEDILLSVKKNIKQEMSNVKSFQQLIKTPRKSVIARSEKQSEYIKSLKTNDIVMALGPAGTGKSFLAVSVAITLLMEKKVERVIIGLPLGLKGQETIQTKKTRLFSESLDIMKNFLYPVIFDATHSVQEPGGMGEKSGGKREFVSTLSKAAVAVGVAGIFIETHNDPDHAPSDGPNMLNIENLESLISKLIQLDTVSKK